MPSAQCPVTHTGTHFGLATAGSLLSGRFHPFFSHSLDPDYQTETRSHLADPAKDPLQSIRSDGPVSGCARPNLRASKAQQRPDSGSQGLFLDRPAFWWGATFRFQASVLPHLVVTGRRSLKIGSNMSLFFKPSTEHQQCTLIKHQFELFLSLAGGVPWSCLMIAGLRQTLRLEVRSTQDLMLSHEKKVLPHSSRTGSSLKNNWVSTVLQHCFLILVTKNGNKNEWILFGWFLVAWLTISISG